MLFRLSYRFGIDISICSIIIYLVYIAYMTSDAVGELARERPLFADANIKERGQEAVGSNLSQRSDGLW